jgi:hypothetical protein
MGVSLQRLRKVWHWDFTCADDLRPADDLRRTKKHSNQQQ